MKNNFIHAGFLILGFFTLCVTSCTRQTKQKLPVMIEIKENWNFSQAGSDSWFKAEVPGTVHSDLLANGQIGDFFYRMNENDLQWIEEEDWVYRATFNVSADILAKDKVELIFKGLDTYAHVFLNDELILETDNMFVGWVVECRDFLKSGENEMRILFISPVREGMKKLEKIDYRIPSTNEQAPVGERTSVFTRKAPFHYGWDWGPRLVTSGIWRPVYLKAWDKARIEDIYLETISADSLRAEIIADVQINSLTGENYLLSLYINGEPSGVSENISLSKGINGTRLEFSIYNPDLWWTNGLGEPHLYDFSFRLEHKRTVIDKYELDYGVRTVKLVHDPDDAGHSFHFEVNGIPVFMKGANIIPSETLTARVTEEMYQNLINNAVEANMNMLRVWGGAIYEEDYFYKLCNRNGLLVWQDFMFACNLQPGDEAHLENIRKEAEYNVKRLRNHASVALWCGNNENLHGWHHWGWQDLYTPEQRDFMWRTYERIFYEILPGAVAEFDPKNSYWSSSPSSVGKELADRKSGDEHDWTVWFGRQPFSNYANNVPRFVSEWGLQAFPGMHTIESFSEPDDWDIDSDVMRHRQRSNMPYIEPGFDGNDMIKWYMEMYYNIPDDFKDFAYVSQLLQAKGYKTAVEAHRRAMPHCMGTLYWQLNDCWPTVSWSTVDYYNRWKASLYAIKKAYEKVIVSSALEGADVNTYVVSDKLEPFEAEIALSLMEFNGNILWSETLPVKVNASTSTLAHSIKESELPAGGHPGSIVLVIDLLVEGKEVATNNFFFMAPRYLDLPPSNVWFALKKVKEGYELELFSDILERNLFIDIPGGRGKFSDNYFDLLPGREKTIKITTDLILDPVTDIIIKSLNDLR